MKLLSNRRKFLGLLSATLAWFSLPLSAQNNPPPKRRQGGQGGGGHGHRDAQEYVLPPELAQFSWLSLVLGRVTDKSVTVSAVAKENIEGFLEYGTATGNYSAKTAPMKFAANQPVEALLENLQPDTQYFYRLQFRKAGEKDFTARSENHFHTQRAAGSSFTFAIQGDSHP